MNNKKRHDIAAGEQPAAIFKKQDRLGVFMKSWSIVTSYGPASSSKHVQSFRPGQLVFDEAKIKDYLAQGAPMRVYIHDEQPTASGID